MCIRDRAGVGLFFNNSSNAITPYDVNGQSQTDADVDLGVGSVRFKDLYLSGGAYLGGTGSDNKLDDYEEGTCTITLSATNTAPTITQGNTFSAKYTKVGNMVTVEGYTGGKNITNVGVGIVKLTGLPFVNANSYYGVVKFTHNTMFNAMDGYIESGQQYFYPIGSGNLSGVSYLSGNVYLMFSVTYLAT